MKFENSKYSKIWDSSEGRAIVTAILNDPELIRANHTFWQTKFRVDPQTTPTNAEGEAIFKSKMRPIQTGVLMDMRAPLGDSTPMEVGGIAAYTGSIPDFIAKGFVEKATERYYKEKMFDQFADLKNVAMYATDVLQMQLDSANQTLSHMSAYLLSNGHLKYLQGEGIQDGLYKAPIPAENFDTAGAKVWTANDCQLLSQMVAKEEKYKDAWGVELPMQWEITREQFVNVFMKNAQVIEWSKHNYELRNGVALNTTLALTEDIVLADIAKFPGLSPIVLAEEKQKDLNNGTVRGWKSGVAVLRPRGYAGLIRHTKPHDEEMFKKFGNNVNSYNFSSALGGIATIMNSTIVNGNFKEWHTDLWMSAIPTLDEFLYHVIIDTTTADKA